MLFMDDRVVCLSGNVLIWIVTESLGIAHG